MSQYMQSSRVSQWLFGDTQMAGLWLIVRLYVGWQWIEAGYEKVISSTWVGASAGAPLGGFLKGALLKTTGPHPDVYDWYAWFLQHAVAPYEVFWSNLVAWGELLVGIALILGFVTGIAAFFGSFMNINYLLAGTVSTNPVLLVLGIGLMLAWRIAGYFGADRYVLPRLFKRNKKMYTANI